MLGMATNLTHIFVIGDEKYEPERIQYLKSYIHTEQIENVTFFQPTFGHTLTQEELTKYVPYNWTQYGRQLRKGEISLFLNFIYIFEKILSEYTEGTFLILESDVIFVDKFKDYLDDMFKQLKEQNVQYDCLSIGSGTDKCKSPTEIRDFEFKRSMDIRCADSLIFTYAGIQSFYNFIQDFVKAGNSLNHPVDNFLEFYFRGNRNYVFMYVSPSLNEQGSHTGRYTNHLHGGQNITEKPE